MLRIYHLARLIIACLQVIWSTRKTRYMVRNVGRQVITIQQNYSSSDRYCYMQQYHFILHAIVPITNKHAQLILCSPKLKINNLFLGIGDLDRLVAVLCPDYFFSFCVWFSAPHKKKKKVVWAQN